MEHDHGKQGKRKGQQVSIHQQDADIHKIKAQKRRVAAESVNAGGDQPGLVLIGDPRPPAVLHAQNGAQEDPVAQHPDAEAGMIIAKGSPQRHPGAAARRNSNNAFILLSPV